MIAVGGSPFGVWLYLLAILAYGVVAVAYNWRSIVRRWKRSQIKGRLRCLYSMRGEYLLAHRYESSEHVRMALRSDIAWYTEEIDKAWKEIDNLKP